MNTQKILRGLYKAALWALAKRRWLIPAAVILLAWLVVQCGLLAQFGNSLAKGAISLVDSLMAVVINLAGPLIALWLIWAALARILGVGRK